MAELNLHKKLLLLLLLLLTSSLCHILIAQDKFPVPEGNPNQLFYLQRNWNTNTIVCELNVKDGILDPDDPVKVFWIRYHENGQKEDLSFVQRKFAYGMKTTLLDKEKYELRFVSYKNFPMYLMKGNDNKFSVYATINNKLAILQRIFIKLNGGSVWAPKVEYFEIKGIDTATGKEVVERLKI
jgi:hypothetical protein